MLLMRDGSLRPRPCLLMRFEFEAVGLRELAWEGRKSRLELVVCHHLRDVDLDSFEP